MIAFNDINNIEQAENSIKEILTEGGMEITTKILEREIINIEKVINDIKSNPDIGEEDSNALISLHFISKVLFKMYNDM